LKLLAAHQQRSFAEQGIAFPLRVLAADDADGYRRECDALETQLGGRPRTVEVRQMHLHYGWAYRLATHERVLDAVEDLLGPNLLIWATELFAKHPHDGVVSIGWHRDGPYMGLAPELTVTAWIALTDSHAANGCMRYLPEAQRQTERRRQPAADDPVADVTLQAGEMSLHDVFVLHGSGPNHSSEKRVGFAIRFTTPEGRPTTERPPAILARGSDHCGHFQLVAPPQQQEPAEVLSSLRQSARRHLDATLENLKQAPR
jgi:non-heme Fe2+,alpha-ketoglutarate-dependent halogenase